MTWALLVLSLICGTVDRSGSGSGARPAVAACSVEAAASGRITIEPAVPVGAWAMGGLSTGACATAQCAEGGFAAAARTGLAVSLADDDRDSWFGSDKVQHFLTAFAVTGYAHAGLRTLDVDQDVAVAGGILVSLAAGVGKEIHDVRAGSFFSVKDLVWDLAGTMVGAGLVAAAR